MVLLLLACADGKLADTPAGDTAALDTDQPDDTGTRPDDTAEEGGWVAPEVPCVLTRPRPVRGEAVPLPGDLHGPDPVELSAVQGNFDTYEGRFGCPTPTEDADSITWEGDCSGVEFSWRGRWISTVTENVLIEEGAGVRFVDDYLTGDSVAFDGYAAFEEDDDGVGEWTRDFTWSLDGSILPESTGDWVVSSYERHVPDAHYTYEGRFDVSNSDLAPDGEYCVVKETFRYEGCDAEPWGGWVLVGDATLVVTYNPQVGCDGCGAVTVDGVAAGEVCGGEYGAYVP